MQHIKTGKEQEKGRKKEKKRKNEQKEEKNKQNIIYRIHRNVNTFAVIVVHLYSVITVCCVQLCI